MSPATVRVVALGVGLGYLAVYLFVLGDLSLARTAEWDAQVAGRWQALWFRPRGLFQFEGIALLQAGRLVFIVSPLNLLLAGLLAMLVAINVHGAIAVRRMPAHCRPGGSGTGILASVPALVAGGACCAPALIILLGLPGLGALAGLFDWLIPISIILLVASRWWQLRMGAPAFRARAL